MAIDCIIVDDEPLALDLMEEFTRRTPFLHLLARCLNATEAIQQIETCAPQLIFLDIEMPGLTGLELSRALTPHHKIIFTTAFSQYAVEGFRVNALDYLLKPFNYEEFLASAYRAREWFDRNRSAGPATTDPFIFVRSEYKHIKIPLNNVLYFEGVKDYVRIWLRDQPRPVMILKSLKALEKELPSGQFMRIHRSYIIALDKIQAVERNNVIINNTVRILVAEQYRPAFQAFLHKASIG